jgi:hypothetical protein
MSPEKKIPVKSNNSVIETDSTKGSGKSGQDSTAPAPVTIARLKSLDSRPRRHPVLHWLGFGLALLSLLLLVGWMTQPPHTMSLRWLWVDIGIGVFSALEFFTRSGFRWNPAGYIFSRFFDFIAIVPALVLIYYSVPGEPVWIWIILAARIARFIDRLLGDGFVERNSTALIGAFEEEITDRVMLRLMSRIEADFERGKFGNALAESLIQNKRDVLNRVRAQYPQEGLALNLARLVGLEDALERFEERVFDSIVTVLASDEIERSVREGIKSTFSVMRKEIRQKEWKKQIGIRRGTNALFDSQPDSSPK